ncbi:hypothetical protein D3C81_1952490 [compost metagenome]
MGEHLEYIRVAEHLAVIVQAYPRLLGAVAVPVREAVVDKLERRIIRKCCQQQKRDEQKGYDDNHFLLVVG